MDSAKICFDLIIVQIRIFFCIFYGLGHTIACFHDFFVLMLIFLKCFYFFLFSDLNWSNSHVSQKINIEIMIVLISTKPLFELT